MSLPATGHTYLVFGILYDTPVGIIDASGMSQETGRTRLERVQKGRSATRIQSVHLFARHGLCPEEDSHNRYYCLHFPPLSQRVCVGVVRHRRLWSSLYRAGWNV